MNNDVIKCMYCGKESFNTPMYVVKKAIKAKRTPHRWKDIGYCCDDCYEDKDENPTQIEFTGAST